MLGIKLDRSVSPNEYCWISIVDLKRIMSTAPTAKLTLILQLREEEGGDDIPLSVAAVQTTGTEQLVTGLEGTYSIIIAKEKCGRCSRRRRGNSKMSSRRHTI